MTLDDPDSGDINVLMTFFYAGKRQVRFLPFHDFTYIDIILIQSWCHYELICTLHQRPIIDLWLFLFFNIYSDTVLEN